MLSDYFKIAFRTLKEKKTRSFLTVLGIFLAIVTIFVLLSLSLGLNEAIVEEFENLGGNKFFIQPRGMAGAPGTGGAVTLTTQDADIVAKVNGVQQVASYPAGNAKVKFLDKTRYTFSFAVPVENK